jgi:hypothetical protein
VGERNAQNRFGEEKQCSLAPDARASGCVRATHAGACGLGCQARHLGASWPLGQAQAGGGAWAACLQLARARGLGWRPTRGLGRAGASELGRDACGGGLAALRAGPSGAGALGRDARGPTRERVGAGLARGKTGSWAGRWLAHEREGWRGGPRGEKERGRGRGWAGRNGPGREAGLKSVFSFSFLFPFSFLFISV